MRRLLLLRLIYHRCCRYKTSLSWFEQNITLNRDNIRKIESHWHNHVTRPFELSHKPKKYVLPMFPYPSGKLHMGHVRVYTITDSIARYYSLRGFDVFQPFGWDGFGLPAENAAKERGLDPDVWTTSNISTMKEQIKQLSCRLNWENEVTTCHPSYYKWTQWIFVQLFKAGLAYRRNSYVNWDPVDQTVLADEQIDSEGHSWRSGAEVEKRLLKQWFIRTTKFAKALYDSTISSNEWKDIALIQKEWLGDCSYHKFHLHPEHQTNSCDTLEVCCKDPVELAHGQFIAITSDHMWTKTHTERISCNGNYRLEMNVVNPINNIPMPVLIIDNAKYDGFYDRHQTCKICCPSIDSVHKEIFQKAFPDKNPIETIPINSNEILENAKKNDLGGYISSCKLNDWVVSRQRYWGTPIPIVHCENCGVVPVPEDQLPVILPRLHESENGLSGQCAETSSAPQSPLANFPDWVNCKCPQCNGMAKRETDTLDTFFDSSFYFLRYPDAHNDAELCSEAVAQRWMPVDVYVGGKEHAVLHFYFARFICHFLHSIGVSPVPEPFSKLMAQGVVMGEAYKLKSTGQYLPKDRVAINEKEKTAADRETGLPVEICWEKMSKSKHNGVDPESVFDEFGSDITRLLMVGFVSPQSERNWSTESSKGVTRWLNRLTFIVQYYVKERRALADVEVKCLDDDPVEKLLKDNYNRCVKKLTFHNEITFLYNTAFAELIVLTNALRKLPIEAYGRSLEFERCLRALIIMCSPIMPHLAAEMWSAINLVKPLNQKIDNQDDVWMQSWPVADLDAKVQLMIGSDFDEPIDSLMLNPEQAKLMDAESALSLAMSKSVKLRKFKLKTEITNATLHQVEHLGLQLILNVEEKQHRQSKMVNV